MTDARLDLNRRKRLGMVEAVWGQHKSVDQIIRILLEIASSGELGLVTRVNPQKADEVKATIPEVFFDKQASCLILGDIPILSDGYPDVAIISGGTSDLSVVSEASLSLRCHGVGVDQLMDVGVAGLHRLLDKLPRLKTARVLIACAGMEGALPTVLTGLVPQPVIGVPVSVGYGVSTGGRSALEGMLASCAPGLVVVNIDNGYGAAMAALRMLRNMD